MASTTEKATVQEFMGARLPEPREYEFTFETFASKNDAVAANKWPADADTYVLAKVNQQAKASAKAAAYNTAVADLKAAYEQTPAYQFKQLVDSLLVAKKSQAEAEALAESILGFNPNKK